MRNIEQNQFIDQLPAWIPDAARRYLQHTEGGASLRDVARNDGCHASTVLRQVRRFENRRDDPLIDEALEHLGGCLAKTQSANLNEGTGNMPAQARSAAVIDEDELSREARRILRRLCESGAVLVLASDMDKAAVLRSHDDGAPTRTAVVGRDVARAFALKEWISCDRVGRVTSYTITAAGRAALKRYLAEDDTRKRQSAGFAEASTPFTAQHIEWGERDVAQAGQRAEKVRCNMHESPLTMLGRRRDKNGTPFLDSALVQAGERFREDFELAQMGPRVAQNWERFLTSGTGGGFAPDSGVGDGPTTARTRVHSALDDLGPGLGDIIIRCCCFLEGLEAAEKRMGWSARSGKVVLRIALQRLRRHYEERHGMRSAMIG